MKHVKKYYGYQLKFCRNTNTIIKQVIPKINMNMKSPSATLGFGSFLHTDTCNILSEIFISHRLQEHS